MYIYAALARLRTDYDVHMINYWFSKLHYLKDKQNIGYRRDEHKDKWHHLFSLTICWVHHIILRAVCDDARFTEFSAQSIVDNVTHGYLGAVVCRVQNLTGIASGVHRKRHPYTASPGDQIKPKHNREVFKKLNLIITWLGWIIIYVCFT